MAFGKQAKQTEMRAFRCGALRPHTGKEAAIESARRRTTLWNALVELETKRRETREALVTDGLPETLTAEEQKAARKARFRDPAVKEQLQALDRETYEAAKPICRAAKCYTWQEDDLLACWRVACRKVEAPRFHRFRPYEGVCALRWQTGLPVAKAMAETDLRLQLLPWPEGRPLKPVSTREFPGRKPRPLADPNSRRSQRRSWRLCRFRVGSEERKPVWVEIPVCLHRPLPEHGFIRQAFLCWHRVGAHVSWSVALVVEDPEAEPKRADPRLPVAALDLGWRRVEDGVRAGFLADTREYTEEVGVPDGWCGEYRKCEEIRSYRDELFNAAKASMRDWLTERVEQGAAVPEWLTERTSHLHQWRAPARLAVLLHHWREHRFDGDTGIYEPLEAWRRRDKHKWLHESNLRDQLVTNRRHRYREFAARLARNYRAVVLEKFDLRDVARKPKGTRENPLPPRDPGTRALEDTARHQRVMAAPSELRAAIENACKRDGVEIVRIKAAYTTMTCHVCGHVETADEFDKARELVHRCVNCGERWDQDERAARNLLSAFAKRKSAAA